MSALEQCQRQLTADPLGFVAVLPVVLSQVGIKDGGFRVQLLKLLANVFDISHNYPHDIRFAVIAGCVEAICFIMTDHQVLVVKELITTMMKLPIIFKTLYVPLTKQC
jgi:hypothetical protein